MREAVREERGIPAFKAAVSFAVEPAALSILSRPDALHMEEVSAV